MTVRHIHQTWRDSSPPPEIFRKEWIESWTALNPGWDYTLWTDEDLHAFVAEFFPAFFPTWAAYPSQIMRVDAWRYLLLRQRGGMYVDLDFLCLEPLAEWLPEEPVFHIAEQGEGILCNAFLWAPEAGLPFFDDIEAELKSTSRDENVISATGPYFLTRYAVKRRSLYLDLPTSWIYPLAWDERHRTEKAARLSLEQLQSYHSDAKAITFWKGSWVGRSNAGNATPTRILVGVCSCKGNQERKQACRDTWMNSIPEGIEAVFFEGGTVAARSGDVVELDVSDSYEDLPEKVVAFFRYALEHFEFEWLFKCDDDTYLRPERLPNLLQPGFDLVGNEFITLRGAPSGGAGYALSRRMVEILAADPHLPKQGDEDVILGKAALAHGASVFPSPLFRYDDSFYPSRHNNLVSAHWCSPGRLHSIHRFFTHQLQETIRIQHVLWEDAIHLYRGGLFRRQSTPCCGVWNRVGKGDLELRWFEWPQEVFESIPENEIEPPSPAGSTLRLQTEPGKELYIELAGGLGNQMFQYAYGLALSKRLRVPLRVIHLRGNRPFALGSFGIGLDRDPPADSLRLQWLNAPRKQEPLPLLGEIHDAPAGPIIISGYFQNHASFESVATDVKELFRLESAYFGGREQPLVAVHVRRGDFVNNPSHDLCRPDYFLSAVAVMRLKLKNPQFVIFSDDIEWCKTRYWSFEDVEFFPALTEMESFAAMQQCDAFILSNSTFGWWAAWLSGSADVIAPNRFLHQTKWDVCPSHWLKLPVEGLALESINGDPECGVHSFLQNRNLKVRANSDYWDRVGLGRLRMKESRVVFCGLARDLGDRSVLSLYLEQLGEMCGDYRIVLFENDSKDDTVAQLESWTLDNPRVTVLSEKLGRQRWGPYPVPKRATEMAEYRNRYLDYVANHHANFDFVVVLDTDLQGGISLDGIANSFGHTGWDAIGSLGLALRPENGQMFHYDSWAFRRRDDWAEVGTWFYDWMPEPGSPPFEVNSCFGGCAIYRTEALLSCRYEGEDCEHVRLHQAMIAAGSRIFLNPSMVLFYW